MDKRFHKWFERFQDDTANIIENEFKEPSTVCSKSLSICNELKLSCW